MGKMDGGEPGIRAYSLRKSAWTSRKRSDVFATNEPLARLLNAKTPFGFESPDLPDG